MNHLLFMETKSTAECAIFILLNNRTDMILNSTAQAVQRGRFLVTVMCTCSRLFSIKGRSCLLLVAIEIGGKK